MDPRVFEELPMCLFHSKNLFWKQRNYIISPKRGGTGKTESKYRWFCNQSHPERLWAKKKGRMLPNNSTSILMKRNHSWAPKAPYGSSNWDIYRCIATVAMPSSILFVPNQDPLSCSSSPETRLLRGCHLHLLTMTAHLLTAAGGSGVWESQCFSPPGVMSTELPAADVAI